MVLEFQGMGTKSSDTFIYNTCIYHTFIYNTFMYKYKIYHIFVPPSLKLPNQKEEIKLDSRLLDL